MIDKELEISHVNKLLIMLESDNPCLSKNCPANQDYNFHYSCTTCLDFLDIYDRKVNCPCHELGKNEAIKLTWLKLEEKGYLDDYCPAAEPLDQSPETLQAGQDNCPQDKED